MQETRYGASPEEWDHFAFTLGLCADLLPVVSNPHLTISEKSKMKGLGKTPSTLNREGRVVGISNWTSQVSTPEQVSRWSTSPNLGLCIQTRDIRAIDVDITDEKIAASIGQVCEEVLGTSLPKRIRQGSSKFLLLVRCSGGNRRKDVTKTGHGIIEYLADGNQCLLLGAHIDKDGVSRSRYEWDGGLPPSIPEVSQEALDELIAVLDKEFGLPDAPERELKSSVTRNQKLHQAIQNDPLAQHLLTEGLVKATERDGRMHVFCPWVEDHDSGPGSDSSSTYFPANTNGYALGHYACLHSHCEDRTDAEFAEAVGFAGDLGFEDCSEGAAETVEVVIEESGEVTEKVVKKALKYEFLQAAQHGNSKNLKWHIKGVLPVAELGVLIGASASGKTFAAINMLGALAQGKPWRGRKTKKTKVAYIVAEGKHGFHNRIKAYAVSQNISVLADFDFFYHAGAPNLMSKPEVADVVKGLKAIGDVGVIVVDTFAQTTTSADENSARDIGVALHNCRLLHEATGATIIILHHLGKDEDKGGRGSTALKAAADVEFIIYREKTHDKPPKPTPERRFCVTKLKDGAEDVEGAGFYLADACVGFESDEDEDDLDGDEAVMSCVVDWGGE